MYEAVPPKGIAIVDIDPFSREFFEDPYPHHAHLRDAGSIVWLSKYNVAAVARYEQVRQMLLDWQTFSSARGVGLADIKRDGSFRLPSPLLEVDPPEHDKMRAIMTRAVSPIIMKSLKGTFQTIAEELVDELLQRREFDAVEDLGEAFPLRVFPDAIGMDREGRHNLLPYGDMIFNSFGPPNEFFEASAPRAQTAFPWVQQQSLRKNLSADGFGSVIYEAVDAGEITEDKAAMLVRGLLTAGVDTTVNGIGAAVYCLGRFPNQWAMLREDIGLAKCAFEEAVRFESPVQTFFRTTTKEVAINDVLLPEGQKVLMFLGSANRDPRKWSNPDDYDITRKTAGHVGFGFGLHVCVGQLLAKLEGQVMLEALARRVRTIEIIGAPIRRMNNTLRGLKNLPVRMLPA